MFVPVRLVMAAQARENDIYFHHPSSYARRSIKEKDPRLRIKQRAAANELEDRDVRRFTDTKELIRRDRKNHNLGLNRLRAMPRDTTHEILQARRLLSRRTPAYDFTRFFGQKMR